MLLSLLWDEIVADDLKIFFFSHHVLMRRELARMVENVVWKFQMVFFFQCIIYKSKISSLKNVRAVDHVLAIRFY